MALGCLRLAANTKASLQKRRALLYIYTVYICQTQPVLAHKKRHHFYVAREVGEASDHLPTSVGHATPLCLLHYTQ